MAAEGPRVVPIIVSKGSPPIWVEIAPNDPVKKQSDWVFVAADEKAAKDAPKTMEEAIERIKPLIATLFEKLSSVATPPKNVELNLGLKLSGSVGIFVAQSSGEAALNVKLTWKT
jgi:Trypsin-co-occurring domain 1